MDRASIKEPHMSLCRAQLWQGLFEGVEVGEDRVIFVTCRQAVAPQKQNTTRLDFNSRQTKRHVIDAK